MNYQSYLKCQYCEYKHDLTSLYHSAFGITFLCKSCESTTYASKYSIHTRYKDVNILEILRGLTNELIDIEYHMESNSTLIEVHKYSDDLKYSKKEYRYIGKVSYKKHIRLENFK